MKPQDAANAMFSRLFSVNFVPEFFPKLQEDFLGTQQNEQIHVLGYDMVVLEHWPGHSSDEKGSQ